MKIDFLHVWLAFIFLILSISVVLAYSVPEAQDIIDFDPQYNVLEISISLMAHGYSVPSPGVVIIDGASFSFTDENRTLCPFLFIPLRSNGSM